MTQISLSCSICWTHIHIPSIILRKKKTIFVYIVRLQPLLVTIDVSPQKYALRFSISITAYIFRFELTNFTNLRHPAERTTVGISNGASAKRINRFLSLVCVYLFRQKQSDCTRIPIMLCERIDRGCIVSQPDVAEYAPKIFRLGF